MKASKQAKRLVDYSDEYNPTIPVEEYPEPSEAEILAQEQQHEAEMREQEENARAREKWEKLGKQNFGTIRDVPNAIGQRLEHLFEEKKIERLKGILDVRNDIADGFDVVCHKQGFCPYSGRSCASFAPRMSPTHDNDVKFPLHLMPNLFLVFLKGTFLALIFFCF